MNFNRMASRTAHTRTVSAEYDEGLRAYMLRVYNYMASALCITGVVALVASQIPQLMAVIHGSFLGLIVTFAPLGIVMYLSKRLHTMSIGKAQTWFWAFAAIMGLSLSYIFLIYTGISIVRTLFVTAASFASLSLYGYTTKRSLTGMGSFLLMGLVGIIIASIVNMFMHSSGLAFAISAIGVLIFAGLTAYDTQRIKDTYFQLGGNEGAVGHAAIRGALSLYLDFINLFIMLLHFMGDRR